MTFIAVGVGVGLAVAGGVTSAVMAGRNAKKQKESLDALQSQMANLESKRQAIIDPSAAIKDMSAQITNPYANLQVATAAAEMQASETEVSLANILDNLRAGGGSAGSATSLAREAARSKQSIAANIQMQEAKNAELRAQGEQNTQQLRMQEAQRVQAAQMRGAEFMFNAREDRETTALSRAEGYGIMRMNIDAQKRQQQADAISGTLGGVGEAFMGYGIGSME